MRTERSRNDAHYDSESKDVHLIASHADDSEPDGCGIPLDFDHVKSESEFRAAEAIQAYMEGVPKFSQMEAVSSVMRLPSMSITFMSVFKHSTETPNMPSTAEAARSKVLIRNELIKYYTRKLEAQNVQK